VQQYGMIVMEPSNYTEYSLESLKDWVHDAVNTDATPEQIVQVIIDSLQENVDYHMEQMNKNAETIALLKTTLKKS
tara:strand:- start:510 stop:737 length:228 start_codon:yes stop_codon:yes gene_type:complete